MTASKPCRTVVLLSGSGTTLQNLIDRMERSELPIEIVRVISSRQDAYGIERARRHGIPTQVIARKDFETWETFNKALSQAVDAEDPDLICFAGFMSLFRPDKKYYGRIMNIHPALIPAFCGKGMFGHHVHEAVLEAGVKITGCTVHFVDENYDTGPIILQKAVEVYDDDTPDSLADRVQATEREAYPEAIRLFAEGRLHLDGRRVKIIAPTC
ncbi:MAG: phosphoribosylglycinamide formyltransferase [Candidatus Omnitrophica bacterium]|nr:phosphoribosylglycinamide formyltransferase [Candidatus Omnitrophota bacterium]